MTIKDFLEGLFPASVSFSDANWNSVFQKWDVDSDSDYEAVGEREQDLCRAELLLILSKQVGGGGSSKKNSESIKRGDFEKSQSNETSSNGYSMTYLDRKALREEAYYLFRKWGIEPEEPMEYHYQIGVL